MLTDVQEAAWQRLRTRARLYWDVVPEDVDPNRHATWLVSRVLAWGTWTDVEALFALYSLPVIRHVIEHSRELPESVRQFWLTYGIEEATMHDETLDPPTQRLLVRFGAALCPPGFVLAGGTALALYLGHRQSEDLDFLAMDPFDAAEVVGRLQATALPVQIVHRTIGSIHAIVDGIKVSYLWQRGIRLSASAESFAVPLADLETLAATKCNAVANRGARKDFVDCYGLCQAQWTFPELLAVALQRAPQLDRLHLLRSFAVFEDAEQQPMPRLLVPWSWDTIRHYFADHVRRALAQLSAKSPNGPPAPRPSRS